MIKTVCVIGAGTMGAGIALAIAQKDYPVLLCDINEAVISGAKDGIKKNLLFLLEREKINEQQKERIWQNIQFTSSIQDCKADLVIEAIVEKIEIKAKLLNQVAALNTPETILASNTSSLSITSIQKELPHPERVAGLHFFNPAHIMKLVEVVKGEYTDDAVANGLLDFCMQIDKVPVLCKDAPGFIVNRVARHYYLEAMSLVENNLATLEDVDAAMEAAGFKMGPFKLMDLIGMDVNLAVSTSLYEAFDKEERFRPSKLQTEKVQQNNLGRKTGRGFYNYKA
ncbi:MAG: 3-hydroxybutyryl-CoA dehydrogenase [Gloeobacteraceae cyanobacterium ES-bin-316]|nr:3-hydroxybutyryl-CoA dehydrogenase [Ferruginibacter sp.]